jgi:hypothetical protein
MMKPNVIQPFRYEHVGPVMWMDPSLTPLWTVDFSIANRGLSEELCRVLVTEFDYEPGQPTDETQPFACLPGRTFVVNWEFELLDPNDYQGWWPRIYTSSRNQVPSIHVYNDKGFPDFYISPGDFTVFELETGIVPPVVGPAKP